MQEPEIVREIVDNVPPNPDATRARLGPGRWNDATARLLRRDAVRLLWEHSGWFRRNCGACALRGYRELTEDGMREPNYAGWQRIYVKAGESIPLKYENAFWAGLHGEDVDFAYRLALDVNTFGIAWLP